jgi:hypothetical protein
MENNQKQDSSRDAALIALAHAHDQFANRNDRVGPEPTNERDSKASGGAETSLGGNPATSSPGSARDSLSMWGLLGLGVLVPAGAIFLAWHLLYRPAEVTAVPPSTSSLPKQSVTKTTSPKNVTEAGGVPPQKSSQPGQQTAGNVPSASLSRPDQPEPAAIATHQLSDTEQEIDRLKADQAQMLSDKTELDKRLRETQELARRNADLIKGLESAQSQVIDANASLAAQLRSSQDQVANLTTQLDAIQALVAKIATQLKSNQDQIARLVEAKQRAKPAVSAALPMGVPPKPAPKPPLQQPKPQTQNPAATLTR